MKNFILLGLAFLLGFVVCDFTPRPETLTNSSTIATVQLPTLSQE